MRRKDGKEKEKGAGGMEVTGSHEITLRFDRMADGTLHVALLGLKDAELARDICMSVLQAIRRHAAPGEAGAVVDALSPRPGEC